MTPFMNYFIPVAAGFTLIVLGYIFHKSMKKITEPEYSDQKIKEAYGQVKDIVLGNLGRNNVWRNVTNITTPLF